MSSAVVDRAALKAELVLLGRVKTTRSTVPILNHVLLSWTGKSLTITASDLSTWLTVSVPCQGTGKWAKAVPWKELSQVVRGSKAEVLELLVEDDNLKIRGGAFEVTLAAFQAGDFPKRPRLSKPMHNVAIGFSEFLGAASKVDYAISAEECRFQLNTMLLDAQQGSATLAATDGHRLALADCKAKTVTPCNVLIPGEVIKNLGRLRVKGFVKSQAQVSWDEAYIRIRLGPRNFVCHRVEGKFPDYRKVFPKRRATCIDLDRGGLLAAAKQVEVTTVKWAKYLRCVLEAEGFAVSTSCDAGSSKALVPTAHSSGVNFVGFLVNLDYLVDVLKATTSETIKLSFFDTGAPLVFSSGAAKALIMPLRGFEW